MKLFLKRVGLFIICLLIAGYVVEKVLEQVPSVYYDKYDYIVSHLDDIKILALGHSHIADGVNMIALNDSGYNAAIPGRHIYYDMCIVEEFAPQMNNLKIVILPLGYNFQYSKFHDVRQKTAMRKSFGYIWPEDNKFIPALDIIGGGETLWRLFKNQNEMQSLDSLGHQHLKKTDRPALWNRSEPRVPSNLKCDLKNRDTYIQYYKRIAKTCLKSKLRLIIITMPAWHEYYEKTTPDGIADLYNIVDSIRKVNPDVDYYNMIDDRRFVTDDFFDASHLNEDGALKFTDILKNEILPVGSFSR